MHQQTTVSSLTPKGAMALVLAARKLQPEVRSFGEDVNEGYLLLHEALSDALREGADAARFAAALRALASKAKADPFPQGELAS